MRRAKSTAHPGRIALKLAFVVVSGLKGIGVIVVLASALSACFTIRYDYVQAPQISGTLFDGANPLKHEYVILSTGVYRPFVESGSVHCKNVEAITTTDDAGNFEFQVVKRTGYGA